MREKACINFSSGKPESNLKFEYLKMEVLNICSNVEYLISLNGKSCFFHVYTVLVSNLEYPQTLENQCNICMPYDFINVSSKLSYELLAINQTHWFFFLLFIFLQDLEFHGVMRFYFQDKAAGNFATKCIRVSSTATTQDVIETLAEKFRPDMRMLSSPKYSLYEVHVSGG